MTRQPFAYGVLASPPLPVSQRCVPTVPAIPNTLPVTPTMLAVA